MINLKGIKNCYSSEEDLRIVSPMSISFRIFVVWAWGSV